MAVARKFLFDTSFDPQARRPEPLAPQIDPEPAPPAPPSFSQEELEAASTAARQEGFESGREQALAEARETAEAEAARATTLFAERLEQAIERLDARRQTALVEVLASATAILRKLFPELGRRHGLAETEALVRSCLEQLHEEPRVVVRAPDALLDVLRQRLDALKLAAAYEGRVVLLADDTLGPGDARIEWADGGAERDGRRLWAEIEEILSHTVAAATDTSDPAEGPEQHLS